MKTSSRKLLRALIVAGLAGLLTPVALAAPLPGGPNGLDPLTIPKYVDPLPVPGAMQTSPSPDASFSGDYYEIALRQFKQQILPATDGAGNPTGFPSTTVWSYGNPGGVFYYPAFTIEAKAGTPVRVKWMNQLVKDPAACFGPVQPPADATACNHLSHIIPIDQTLHWANPGGGAEGKDMECMPEMQVEPVNCQSPYTGPVPMVVHLHGGHVGADSDGYPTAWWLPAANDIPAGYATQGTNYTTTDSANTTQGSAVYTYPNDQRATTLWYHDHSLGMTRANVQAGPAGFYLIRGGADDVAPGALPGGKYEIPIVVQDRTFNADGSLFYPDSRTFFDGFAGPYKDDPLATPSDISPIHNPEFFGNTMVVNGKTWPFLNVEPRKYRFRFLNGTDSRFLILKPSDNKLVFTQIGSEGGFLPASVVLSQLLVGPAERADVIVDFAQYAPGTKITLLNVAPDSPFGGNFPANQAADAATTGQVMQFVVVAPDPAAPPDIGALPKFPKIQPLRNAAGTGRPDFVRRVSLNELMSSLVCVDGNNVATGAVPNPITMMCPKGQAPAGPASAQLGTVDPVTLLGIPHPFADAITEKPKLGDLEAWEISNFTADAHPIHLHQVMFQVTGRQVIGGKTVRPPEPWETGWKDTVVSYPGEITFLKTRYDLPGLYVWHCHILSHEDNDMMRPLCVVDPSNPAACAAQ